MAHNAYEVPAKLVGLPVLVSTPSDVGRLLRELENLDEALRQAKLAGKTSDLKLSRLLQSTFDINKLSEQHVTDRATMLSFLRGVKKSAPTLHMSFSADPDVPFMEKLISYLRKEIHPVVLVTVGLQPNIAAGCIVRSTNKYFDFSLRKDFDKSKSVLVDKLKETNDRPQRVEPEAGVRAKAPAAKEVHA